MRKPKRDRLKVLDFISLINKFVDDDGKLKLADRIPEYLINSDLTEKERSTLETFRASLIPQFLKNLNQ